MSASQLPTMEGYGVLPQPTMTLINYGEIVWVGNTNFQHYAW